MSDLKKIQFNLYPDEYDGDRVALDSINGIRQKERGRGYRAFLLAGAALYQLDKRLPYLLAELLTEETSLRDVQSVFNSVLPGSFTQDETVLADLVARLEERVRLDAQPGSNEPVSAPPSTGPTEEELAIEATRRNSQKMFGEDD